jgi:hypothetical protein
MEQSLDRVEGFYWTVFEESLAPIADFIMEHRRRPAEGANADKYERRFAARLRSIENRRLSEEQVSLLSAALTDVPAKMTRREEWFQTADEVEQFTKRERRLPKQGAADDDERRLASWINEQRQRFGSHDEVQVRRLERIPDWYWKQDLDAKFREDADRVEAFVRASGRLPNRNSEDAEEARLARWCSSRKMEAKGTGGRRLRPGRLGRLAQIPGLLD